MLSKRLIPLPFRRNLTNTSRFSDKTKVPKICSVDQAFPTLDRTIPTRSPTSEAFPKWPSAFDETFLTRPPTLDGTFPTTRPINLDDDALSPPHPLLNSAFDEIIDVRTHAEFLEDHIPGASNLPVLDESQRSIVGKLHNKDAFQGHKTGAALISANIGDIIERRFLEKSADYKPLLYCWRGGLRSHSLALVLANVGFDVTVLEGGHKKYRERVRADLESLPPSFDFRVISGPTGSGKSAILRHLKAKGDAQILDLELLAKHKGSVLGQYPNENQPKQKLFESLLWHELRRFDPSSPVWVESESKRIGHVGLPESLFSAMKTAQRVDLVVPLRQRVEHTISDYPYFVQNPDNLKTCLAFLSPKIVSAELMERWNGLIDAGDWRRLVESLLVDHYDPTYAKSQAKNSAGCVSRRSVEVESLDADFVRDYVVPRLLNCQM